MFDEFHKDKNQEDYRSAFREPEPLVSICIATYNRADLLVSRCLTSLLNQDYKNIEIIVVGDQCTDNTAHAIKALNSDRINFKNLCDRGIYPTDSELRWLVAGAVPLNHALQMAQGQFLAHLDDDDTYMFDRISKLVEYAMRNELDVVYHPFLHEDTSGEWHLNTAHRFRHGQVTNGSVLYHHWFKRIPVDLYAYRFQEPGDWNRYRKFKYLGAKVGRFPEPLLRHYRERNQRAQ